MASDKEHIGPLWGFFQYIKEKSTIPLSLDQYFYLINAIHRLNTKELNSVEDLLEFTKIFWLNDYRFTDQYHYFFHNFFDWDKLFRKSTDQKPKSSISDVKKSTSNTGTKTEVEKKVETDEGAIRTNPEGQSTNAAGLKETLVDFELVLRDSSGGSPVQGMMSGNIDHSFFLSDLAIMPFDARKFVQRLRRKVETAEQVQSDTIDIVSMVENHTRSGYIEEIIYESADASHSNVVLLEDRFGSMLAYEYLESHLSQAFGQIPYCDFQHYFFYNLPEVTKDRAHYELRPAIKGLQTMNTQSHDWNQKTWFFVLSDAGAHSGLVNRERIKGSLKMWRYFKAISKHVYWINPVPFEYLNDCSAKRLQMTIPMINPDHHSLNQMILKSKFADRS